MLFFHFPILRNIRILGYYIIYNYFIIGFVNIRLLNLC